MTPNHNEIRLAQELADLGIATLLFKERLAGIIKKAKATRYAGDWRRESPAITRDELVNLLDNLYEDLP